MPYLHVVEGYVGVGARMEENGAGIYGLWGQIGMSYPALTLPHGGSAENSPVAKVTSNAPIAVFATRWPV